MTLSLYLTDAYLREFEGTVSKLADHGVVLDESTFYPGGGGQPCDSGTLVGPGGESWTVSGAEKSESGVIHWISEEPLPSPGDRLRGSIHWERRYQHMRYHTALHILSGVVFHRFGSGITGGQIYSDRARMDFSLPDFSRGLADSLIEAMNQVVQRAIPIHVRFISREEATHDPSLIRVAVDLMPEVSEVRLVDIEGFDVQADGGTHVRSTREVGEVRLEKIENKGARNKRLTLTLGPSPRDLDDPS